MDSEARNSLAAARYRPLTPSAFITSPGACRKSGGAAPASRNAMAIMQIHTHRRNRHGSCRDGEGGALDA